MKFTSFQKQMQDLPMFSPQDLRIIFPRENLYTLQTQVSDWSYQGKLVRLKNGLSVLSSDYVKEELSPEVMAARLYSPSYISLEYALAKYGMIPEAVFTVTSVTPKPTRTFKTPFGTFRYQTIKPSCFSGFSAISQGKFPVFMASREKALVDFLYLNSSRFTPRSEVWDAMRIQNLQEVDFPEARKFAEQFKNKKLMILLTHLQSYDASH